MANVREAGAAGTIFKRLVARYFPGHELKRPFNVEEIAVLGRVADVAKKFNRPVEIYIEAACEHERGRGESRPPTLVQISGERYMRHLIDVGAVSLWETTRKRSSSEQHQARIHEIINDGRYWDLQTVPVEELAANERFVEMFSDDEGQPFGIWQATLVRYFEAYSRKQDR